MVFPHFLFIIGVGFGGSLGTSVVIRRQPEKQTKESARRDGAAVARLLCGHMFLLCGCGPYVSIVWRWAICFYWLAVGHMFLLCVYMCICVCVYVYVYMYVCICVRVYVYMYVCICVRV